MKRVYRNVDGILLLDKPVGMTSNRALQIVKRLYQARKAGHTGSLDPLASGMLPLCFGQATKVSHWLLDADKTYEVTFAVGAQTDTADADGEVIATSDERFASAAQLEELLEKFTGTIKQIPPMYSALKRDGKRLYELAREGQVVEREPREVTIHELELLEFDPQVPRLRVSCSKGTYIRTLVEDIAQAAGLLAHVADLRRTGCGPFAGEPMHALKSLEALADNTARLDELLISPDIALKQLPEVALTADEAFYFCRGNPVGHAPPELSGMLRVYDAAGRFLGVGEVAPAGAVAPKRLFLPFSEGS
jgi:tRNA pseudouridine55 synthase